MEADSAAVAEPEADAVSYDPYGACDFVDDVVGQTGDDSVAAPAAAAPDVIVDPYLDGGGIAPPATAPADGESQQSETVTCATDAAAPPRQQHAAKGLASQHRSRSRRRKGAAMHQQSSAAVVSTMSDGGGTGEDGKAEKPGAGTGAMHEDSLRGLADALGRGGLREALTALDAAVADQHVTAKLMVDLEAKLSEAIDLIEAQRAESSAMPAEL